ncbi:hypothetical protein KBY19_19100 [Streptomyces sp. B15]|nr:hypothetical protein [Streptomyces sp. B15]
MLVYPAGVDLSTSALRFLARELTARRLAQGTRWRRLTAGRQALLVLAHLRCGHTYAQAMATLKTWRLMRKLRCSTSRITSLVQAVLTLHLTCTN